MSRFRIEPTRRRGDRQRVLIDGHARGVNAVQDEHGLWNAEIVGVPLVAGLWSQAAVERWLGDNLDPDLLANRPLDSEI